MYYIISILFGLIPEVLYFTLFLSYTKKLKGKKVLLFLLTSIIYFCCMLISQYQLIYYLLFIALMYIALKILYKNKIQIIDVFLISILFAYVCLTSYICFLFVKNDFSNYYLLAFIQKIILFLPLIFRNKFNLWYKKYYSLWNRNYINRKPIKSITLRNISLILLNLFIFSLNLVILYLLTKVK